MDRTVYNNSCMEILNDKFKILKNDPTLLRGDRLQRFIRKLKKQGSITDCVYSSIFSRGSEPACFYGLPKLHKHKDNNTPPPLRPLVSSINSYNYNLAEYLCDLLNPIIRNDYTTKDSFTFADELHNEELTTITLFRWTPKASSPAFN